MDQQLVRRHQQELCRSGFLLTGDRQRATQLAASTLLDHLMSRKRTEPGDTDRVTLLLNLGHHYLAGDDGEPVTTASASKQSMPSIPRPDDLIMPASAQRAQVDDERSRTLNALGRLEPAERLALILRDYHHIDEEQLAQLLDTTPHQLHAQLESVRQRIQSAISAPTNRAMREQLAAAATDAPRVQLWPLVEEPLGEQEQHRRQRQQLLTASIVGGVVVVLVVAAVWLVGGFGWLTSDQRDDAEAAMATRSPEVVEIAPPTPVPEPSPTPVPNLASLDIPQGNVSSALLLNAFSSTQIGDERQQAAYIYDVTDDQLEPAPAERSRPIRVSPNGRWILSYVPNQMNSDNLVLRIVDTQTNEVTWTNQPLDTAHLFDIVLANDKLYAFTPGPPSEIKVFDIESGDLVTSRADILEEMKTDDVEWPQWNTRNVRLFATPDGSQLWVYLIEGGPAAGQSMPETTWTWALASYSLPDLTLQSKQIKTFQGPLPQGYSLDNPHWTPDGKYLVTVADGDDRLIFHSPDAEQRLELELPFAPVANVEEINLALVPSNTGRYLYVLAVARKEVAVVDLLARQVLLTAPIDTAGFSVKPVIDGRGGPFRTINALSADGTRLYIANIWTSTGQIGGSEHGAPITVIDTTTWTVAGQWDVPSMVFNLFPLNDGRQIGVLHFQGSANSMSSNPPRTITVFDAMTGEQLYQRQQQNIALPEWADSLWVNSLFTLYRNTYGRSPMLDGVQFSDARTTSSLPRVRLTTETGAIAEGVPHQLAVRIEDPVTGSLLTGEHPDVRFDPDSIVSVTLHHSEGEADDTLLVLNRDDDGVYRTTASFATPGEWDATVTVTPPEGDPWSVTLSRAVSVAVSLAGTDGQRYIAVGATDPAEPEPNAPVTITVRIVDVENGKLIPEGVGLAGGLPEQIDIMLSAPESGFSTIHLQPVEHGVYRGQGEFWGPGRWVLQARFQLSESREYIYINTGTVTVGS